MVYFHEPVMLKEILEYLDPQAGGKFIDCTLGGAGYTLALAERVGQSGKIISTDLDELAISNAKEKIAAKKLSNIILVNDNFKNLRSIVAANFSAETKFNGIVLDLGLSSAQLEDEERGFSFKGERPLNMAMGEASERSTEEIVNGYPLLELTRIFREYGEEKWAYQIAKAIVSSRQKKRIKTTADLVEIVERSVPKRFHHKIHPATRIFQALRMETNDELGSLSSVLEAARELLKPAGRLVVVSFHSGEDRIVKRFLKNSSDFKILTKKPLIPTEEESEKNPRARSAKLRAAEKIN